MYDIRKSAFDLGLNGLAGFVPLPLLALPSGQLANRFPRWLVFAGAMTLQDASREDDRKASGIAAVIISGNGAQAAGGRPLGTAKAEISGRRSAC